MLVAIKLDKRTPGEHYFIIFVMPKRPDFILQLSIKNIEDFSPEAIVRLPRSFRPQDVQNACANVALKVSNDTPASILTLSQYIAIDFFALAHSTGLYNRQIKLWEGLARTTSIEVRQASTGLFFKQKLPEFDFAFLDHKNRTLALAHFVLPSSSAISFDYLKSSRNFLSRAALSQGISGLFLCYPSPFPAKVLESIRKQINAADSIARYESVLPKLGVPVNLLEMDHSYRFGQTEQAEIKKLRLIHPDLSKRKPGHSANPAVDPAQFEADK